MKSAPLTPLRLGIKISLIVLGCLFFYVVARSKGDDWNGFKNLEGILGLLAVHIGFCLQGDVRLASSGDVADSYEERGGEGERKTFSQWVSALAENEDECKLGKAGSPYYYWINMRRVAWARPCWTYELYGLACIPVYLGYLWVIDRDFHLTLSPMLADLNLLTFPQGTGSITMVSWLLAVAGLAAFLTSLSIAVDVRACGGVQDRFRMSSADRARFMDALAGLAPPAREVAKTVVPAAVAAAPKSVSLKAAQEAQEAAPVEAVESAPVP